MPPITGQVDPTIKTQSDAIDGTRSRFLENPEMAAFADSAQYLSIKAIRDGQDKSVISALSETTDFENNLLKFELAKLHAENYGISVSAAFQMIDQLNADYLMGAPTYKSAARSILDSGRAAALMLKLGKTASEYMGSGLGFGNGPSEIDKKILSEQMDIIEKDIAGLQIDDMPKHWFKSWLKDVASIAPYTFDVAASGVAAGLAVGAAGATMGVTAAPAFVALKSAITAGMRFKEAFEITRGLNFREMVKRGIPEEEAIYWSDASAAMASAIEAFIGTEKFLGDAFTGAAKTGLIEKIITRAGIAGVLESHAAKFVARIALSTAGEIAEEVPQAFIDGMATIFAEEAAGLDKGLDPMTMRQVGRSMAEAAWKAAVTAPLLGIPGSVAMLIDDKKKLADITAMATSQTKDSFTDLVVASKVLDVSGVSVEEQQRLAGNIWEKQADAFFKAQQTAKDVTKERAKSGKLPSGATVNRLGTGELLITEATTGNQGEVSMLIGDPNDVTDIYGEVTVLPSDKTVVITGADIRADYVAITKEILDEIARRNPGKELVLGEAVQDDQAIVGGFESFVEDNGSAIAQAKPLQINSVDAQRVRERLTELGVDKRAVSVAVPFMTVLKRAAGVDDARFESEISFESSQNTASYGGKYKEMIGMVAGATKDVITIGTKFRGDFQADTLMHELIHYFRAFVSRYNPDNAEFKAIEKELGVVDGRWFEAADEKLVQMVLARLAKRDGGDKKDFLSSVSSFLKSLYQFFDEKTAPEAKKALDTWFSKSEGIESEGELFINVDREDGRIKKLEFYHRADIDTYDKLLARSKASIEQAAKKFGKPESYFRDIFNKYYPAITTISRRLSSHKGNLDSFYTAFASAIKDGSWVISPQFVAWIKRGTGEALTKEESDLIQFADDGQYVESEPLFSKIDKSMWEEVYGTRAVVAFDSAVKDVGITLDHNEAGFVLPDGRMLNFSGGKKGERSLEHSQLEYQGAKRDPSERVYDFINYGAARVDFQAGILELGMKPTQDQMDKIVAGFENQNGGFAFVDMRSDDGRLASVRINVFDKASMSLISRFYNGQSIRQSEPTVLYSTVEDHDNLSHIKAQTGAQTNPSEYTTFEAWMDSMFANTDSMSERDKEWFKARYEHAYSPSSKGKQFPNKGSFITFLKEGNNFFNFIYHINKAIHGKDRFSDEDLQKRGDRVDAAISKTPEIKNLVDAMNRDGVRPSAADMRAFMAKASKNEALYKYLYALVTGDQNLGHEAMDELAGVPELIKLEMTGSENVTIADQEEILDALRGTELEDKVASGTITIDELKEYINRAKAEDKANNDEQIAAIKAQAKSKVKEEREKAKAKLAAYKEKIKAHNAAVRLQKQMEKVIRAIFKAPSHRAHQFYASLIMAFQEALRAKREVKKEDLRWASSFRGQYDKNWNERLDAYVGLINAISGLTDNQIPLEIAKALAKEIQAIEKLGIEAKRDQDASWDDVTQMIRAGIMADLRAKKYWKDAVAPGSKEDKDRQKKLAQMAKWFDQDRPDAWFKKYLGNTAARLMFDESLRARSAKFANYDRRTAPVVEFIAKNKMMTKDKLQRELVLENIWGENLSAITITGSELVGIRLLVGRKDNFNEYQRKAFIYGNTFSSQQKAAKNADEGMTGEYDAKLDYLLKFLDDKMSKEEEQLADLMLIAFNNDGDWYRFANTMIFLSNKEPKKEKFYFPILRQGSFEEGEDEVLDRLKDFAMEAKLDGGMAIERINITPKNHKQVKYDALEVFFNAIAKQEHLIEVGPYIKRLRGVFRHGSYSDALRNSIKQSIGQKALDYIDAQIDTLTNPAEYKEKASGAEALTFWKGSMVVSNLAWRWSSVLMQLVTSPMTGYAEAPLHMLPSSIKAYTNPLGFINDIEARSTLLKHRQLTSEQAILEKRNQLGVATFLEKTGRLGMKPLAWADRISVAIVWDAVRQKEEDKGASKAEAEDYADRYIIKTQPTAEEADRAPMYRDPNAFKQLVLQFTQPLNVIYNNIRNDIPELAKDQEFGKIVGFITAYAMSGIAIGMIAALRGRGPEDDEEAWARYIIHASTSQFTDAIPFIGQIVTGLTGYAITGDNNSWLRMDKNMPAADSIARGIESLMNKSGPDYGKFMVNVAKGIGMMSGAPVKAAEEYYNAIASAFGGE